MDDFHIERNKNLPVVVLLGESESQKNLWTAITQKKIS